MQHARVPRELWSLPVSHGAFRVLVALIGYSDKDGRCHPTNARIETDCGMARATVTRAMHELVNAGLVSSEGGTRGRSLQLHLSQIRAQSDGRLGSKMDPIRLKSEPRLGSKVSLSTKNIPENRPRTVCESAHAREEREPFDPTDDTHTPSLVVTPDPEPTLAERVAAILRRPKDPDVAGMLGCWIAGVDEGTVLASAHEAASRAQGDPVRYFIGMCKSGLKKVGTKVIDSPPRPAPAHGYNGVTYPQTNRRPTPEDLAAHEARLARMAPVKPARPPKPGIKLAGSA